MKIAILGATGRTGRQIVALALEAGHEVRALCRRPDALAAHPSLTLIVGALKSPAFQQTVDGCEAVISALGPGPDEPRVCSTAAEQAVAYAVKRYISISGAGLDFFGYMHNPYEGHSPASIRRLQERLAQHVTLTPWSPPDPFPPDTTAEPPAQMTLF